MNDFEKIAADNQRTAHELIKASGVRAAWQSVGAEVHLVGSLATGLLAKHRDIDFHIYTDTLEPESSFKAISKICATSAATRLDYRNLANTEEDCLEWHVWYKWLDREWQIDMIQIRRGSRFYGYFERVAERINAVLTTETRRAILELKCLTPETEHIMGIEYYQAVIADGVRSYPEFTAWRKAHPVTGIVTWMP
ncbi:MAG: nucleotidyltransferase domain-containing protein [Victivallaceae bacterium]|nr:nucleotidyltransferase domain-containing protein [Victivallaceae bacterium]